MATRKSIVVANVMEKASRTTGKKFWIVVDSMGTEYFCWTSAFTGLVGSTVEVDVTQGMKGQNISLVAVQQQSGPQPGNDFVPEKSPYLSQQEAQRLDKLSSMSMAYAKDIVVALIEAEKISQPDELKATLADMYLNIKNQLEIQAELTD